MDSIKIPTKNKLCHAKKIYIALFLGFALLNCNKEKTNKIVIKKEVSENNTIKMNDSISGDSLYNLYLYYQEKENDSLSNYYLTLAIQKGNSDALLGKASYLLIGCNRIDTIEAINILKQLLDKKYTPAYYKLSILYIGKGQIAMGIDLLKNGALLNDEGLAFILSELYLNGQTNILPKEVKVNIDSTESINYLKIAANNGYSIAQYRMAEYYHNGFLPYNKDSIVKYLSLCINNKIVDESSMEDHASIALKKWIK